MNSFLRNKKLCLYINIFSLRKFHIVFIGIIFFWLHNQFMTFNSINLFPINKKVFYQNFLCIIFFPNPHSMFYIITTTNQYTHSKNYT